MMADRSQQIADLVAAALTRTPDERASFLASACASDLDLLAAVASQISACERPEDPTRQLSDEPPINQTTDYTYVPAPSLVGRSLRHYRVISRLGAGGMGEVYLALDSHLGRRVALKVLPVRFTDDAERLGRFVAEAKAASALNHPGIITIHEIGQDDDVHFIVTEFIDGQTLRQRLARGKTPVAEAIEIITQVASALAAAHLIGIIHRDIKPENIMLRPDGFAKVLDFGLAKLTHPSLISLEGEETGNPAVKTRSGMIVGTVSYMSPEQARGLELDQRSDIFSLGVVLYEMVAGVHPFAGKTAPDIMAAILCLEPVALSRIAPELPAELTRIIERALSKDPDHRHQNIGEMLGELKSLVRNLDRRAEPDAQDPSPLPAVNIATTDISLRTSSNRVVLTAANTETHIDTLSDGGARVARRQRRYLAVAGFALVVLSVAGYLAYRLLYGNASDMTTGTPTIVPVTSLPGREFDPVFSPDGSQIAFAWNGEKEENDDIYITQINAGGLLRLTNNPHAESSPSWSSDGQYIAYYRQTPEGDGIFVSPSLGGTERRLLELLPARGYAPRQCVSWSPIEQSIAIIHRDTIDGPFYVALISPETGAVKRLTSPPAHITGDTSVSFSPDGKTIAFVRAENPSIQDIYLVDLNGGEPRRLTFDKTYFNGLTWTADGKQILYTSNRSGNVSPWRVAIEGGTPEPYPDIGQYAISPSISRRGDRLIFSQASYDPNIWRLPLSGATTTRPVPTKFISSTLHDHSPQYSPDGKRIAFVSNRLGSDEIWICNSEGGDFVKLTSIGRQVTGSPRWSPDGRQIVFDSRPDGNPDLYVISVDGGQLRRLTTENSEDIVPTWSRDGRWIYFGSNRSGIFQIWKIPAAGGPAIQVTKGGGFEGFESVDGKYIYYTKARFVPGFWRMSTERGEEAPLLNHHRSGFWRSWSVTEKGIYFATAEVPASPLIEFYDFASGKVSEVVRLDKEILRTPPGLSVSPDGRWLVYMQIDQKGSDIMLLNNFR